MTRNDLYIISADFSASTLWGVGEERLLSLCEEKQQREREEDERKLSTGLGVEISLKSKFIQEILKFLLASMGWALYNDR